MAFAKEGLLLLSSARSWPVGQGSSCNLTLGPGVCLQVTGLTKKYQHMQCKQALSKHVIAFNSFQPCSGTSTGATTSVHGCWWAHVWPASSCQRTLWPCTGTTCRDNHAWSYMGAYIDLSFWLGNWVYCIWLKIWLRELVTCGDICFLPSLCLKKKFSVNAFTQPS